MNNTIELVNELLNNRELKSEDQIEGFVKALRQLKQKNDVSILPVLFTVFYDSASEIHPLQSLLTYIETYKLGLITISLLMASHRLWENAPRWTITIYSRLINHPQGLDYLRKALALLSMRDLVIVRMILRQLQEQNILNEYNNSSFIYKFSIIIK